MPHRIARNAGLVVSPGTRVVTRVAVATLGGEVTHAGGAVAVITQSPADHRHAYRVRFPDGSEAALRRAEFDILKEAQRDWIRSAADPSGDHDLLDSVIYRCVVGSRAYGLHGDDADVDRRGIYLPPATMHWSLDGVPEQLQNQETDECYWELQKFLTLALKANPNILECLYTPLVEHATPLAERLRAMRDRFLSKLIYQTYNG